MLSKNGFDLEIYRWKQRSWKHYKCWFTTILLCVFYIFFKLICNLFKNMYLLTKPYKQYRSSEDSSAAGQQSCDETTLANQ